MRPGDNSEFKVLTLLILVVASVWIVEASLRLIP